MLLRRTKPGGQLRPPGLSLPPIARRLSGSFSRVLADHISADAAPLRRDVQASVDRALTEVDLGLLAAYRADIRDLTGAREAVFWRWSESRDALVPWAWSTPGTDRPAHFRMAEWGPRVQLDRKSTRLNSSH